jgi:hypothetical protein
MDPPLHLAGLLDHLTEKLIKLVVLYPVPHDRGPRSVTVVRIALTVPGELAGRTVSIASITVGVNEIMTVYSYFEVWAKVRAIIRP